MLDLASAETVGGEGVVFATYVPRSRVLDVLVRWYVGTLEPLAQRDTVSACAPWRAGN